MVLKLLYLSQKQYILWFDVDFFIWSFDFKNSVAAQSLLTLPYKGQC